MGNVTVIDSIMGSGKTTAMINEMNKNQDKKYLYITPYLDEVERIKEKCSNMNFKEPTCENIDGTKLGGLKRLLTNEHNIVSTHSLFTNIDLETELLLKGGEYTLILDEVFEVVKKYKTSSQDVKIMIEQKLITIEDDGLVIWNDYTYRGRFYDVMKSCETKTLYHSNGSFFFWCFPARIFDYFKDSYILTYLFDGQVQRYYYDMFDVEYSYKSAKLVDGEYKVVDYYKDDTDRTKLKELINIYEGKLNTNYYLKENKYHTELSSTWFTKAEKEQTLQLKNNLRNWFKTVNKTKTRDTLWTTIKSKQQVLKGEGYTKSFIPLNTRATNNYRTTTCLAYVYNKYLNPLEANFFRSRNIRVEEDKLALSELLQWVWRSAIRDGKQINVYVPSRRMRELLTKYLNGEI